MPKEKITPRKDENQPADVGDVAISLERLSWSNHVTTLKKHKSELQNPGTATGSILRNDVL
jgi:hypothetical protein